MVGEGRVMTGRGLKTGPGVPVTSLSWVWLLVVT